MTIDDLLAAGAPPIVAILRGVRPEEALPIAAVLVEAGIRMIEVPLNSPDPFDSIEAIVAQFGGECMVGAGTVLQTEGVDALIVAGGRLMVTPNTNQAVIAHAVRCGLEVMPGFMTPTEAFQAIEAGAHRIKLFPASALGGAHLKAIREVLPRHVGVWAVGGTDANTIVAWLAAGAEGIGVGGALYRAGDDAEIVKAKARHLVLAWRRACLGELSK